MQSNSFFDQMRVTNLEKQKDFAILLQTYDDIALDVVEIEHRLRHAPGPRLRSKIGRNLASSRAPFTPSLRSGGASRAGTGPRKGILAAVTARVADQQMFGG